MLDRIRRESAFKLSYAGPFWKFVQLQSINESTEEKEIFASGGLIFREGIIGKAQEDLPRHFPHAALFIFFAAAARAFVVPAYAGYFAHRFGH